MHDMNEKFDNNIRHSIWHATGNDIDDKSGLASQQACGISGILEMA